MSLEQTAAEKESVLADLEREAEAVEQTALAAIDAEDPHEYMAALKRARTLPAAIADARQEVDQARIRVLEKQLQLQEAAVIAARIPADDALVAYEAVCERLIETARKLRASMSAVVQTSDQLHRAKHPTAQGIFRVSPPSIGTRDIELLIAWLRSDQLNHRRTP